MKNRWTEDNMVQGKIINEWAHSDHTGGNIIQDSQDLVNSSSKWEWCCTWRTSLSGFNLLNMVIDRYGHTIECKWMLKRCIPSRLTMRPSILKLKGAFHYMNMGDKLNIIDDANAFLFTIWFDKLRGIPWEEHWAFNKEPCTASYEMHVWMTR
jgi:hypothetical protein